MICFFMVCSSILVYQLNLLAFTGESSTAILPCAITAIIIRIEIKMYDFTEKSIWLGGRAADAECLGLSSEGVSSIGVRIAQWDAVDQELEDIR